MFAFVYVSLKHFMLNLTDHLEVLLQQDLTSCLSCSCCTMCLIFICLCVICALMWLQGSILAAGIVGLHVFDAFTSPSPLLPPACLIVIPSRRPCMADEFQCGDKTCILKEYLCDNRLDCSDMSDEINCGECLRPPSAWCPAGLSCTAVAHWDASGYG